MKLDTILVPLDGSALAESAIPIKKGLGRTDGVAEVNVSLDAVLSAGLGDQPRAESA